MINKLKSYSILFSIEGFSRGGKERQLAIMTKYLLNKGYNIHIITLDLQKSSYLNEYNIPISIVHLVRKQGYLKTFKQFFKKVQDINPDIVFSWDTQTSYYCLRLFRRLRFLFINGSIQHGIRLWNITHLFRSVICWISPYTIANSYAGLKANNLRQNNRRFVLYNGIENKFLKNSLNINIEEKRRQLLPGYPETSSTIIYVSVANMIPYKDYFTVLKALSKLKEIKKFYYIIIGEGPMRNKITSLVKELNLEEHVFFVGTVENVSDYLSISDIMIHSSRGEGISNAILEGMYSGLPVIATNVGGIPETVYPDSSMLFPYKDDNALLGCLLKAPVKFAIFDKNSDSYKKHLEKFSIDNMIHRFEEIIEQMVNNNKKTSSTPKV